MTIIISLQVFGVAPAVDAQDEGYVKKGWYVGAFATQTYLSGALEGKQALDDVGRLVFVPSLDSGPGFNFVFGSRMAGGAVEFGYQQSTHKTSGALIQPVFTSEGPVLFEEGEASYHVLEMNAKIDIFAQRQIRPYILLGAGYSWLNIERNAFDYSDDLWSVEPGDENQLTGSYENTTFGSFNLNLGAGVAYYVHPRIAIITGVIYRWNWFDDVDVSYPDTLSEKAFTLTVGVTLTF